MKCRECKYMQEIGDSGLYICSNKDSDSFGEYTGICCEDECEDGEELCSDGQLKTTSI